VKPMKAWVGGGIAPLIINHHNHNFINLASDPCSALVEVRSQVHTPADLTMERPYWIASSRLQSMLAMRQ
jgi:hypothetical protein